MGGIPSSIQCRNTSFPFLEELIPILKTNRSELNAIFPDQFSCESNISLELLVSTSLKIPNVLHVLSTLYGRKKIEDTLYPSILDDDPFQNTETLTIESADDIQSFAAEGLMKYSVSAECAELSDIGSLREFLQSDSVIGLNLANNQISDSAIAESSTLLKDSSLSYLHIGGNALSSLHILTTNGLPNTLLVLDLSFSEDISLTPGMFLACPQLLHLSLDGCGIASTVFPPPPDSTAPEESALEKACRSSVFYGLVNLARLSLRENALKTRHDMEGLGYFAVQSDPAFASLLHSDAEENTRGGDIPATRLTCLLIAENPLGEISAELAAVRLQLAQSVPSLRSIDGFAVNSEQSRSVDMAALMAAKAQLERERGVEGGGNIPGGAAISDSLEMEYLAALKGERDDTVVS